VRAGAGSVIGGSTTLVGVACPSLKWRFTLGGTVARVELVKNPVLQGGAGAEAAS
jgi:hypothetical protein